MKAFNYIQCIIQLDNLLCYTNGLNIFDKLCLLADVILLTTDASKFNFPHEKCKGKQKQGQNHFELLLALAMSISKTHSSELSYLRRFTKYIQHTLFTCAVCIKNIADTRASNFVMSFIPLTHQTVTTLYTSLSIITVSSAAFTILIGLRAFSYIDFSFGASSTTLLA